MLLFCLDINRYVIREWSRSSCGDFYSCNDTKIFQTFVQAVNNQTAYDKDGKFVK
jgi:hypothetical protein